MDSKHKPTVGIETTNPKSMPKEHSEIPVWNSENWFYEDVIIGHKIRSIRRTISEGESMQFNCMVLDMHPYVGDEIFAKEEGMFNRVTGRTFWVCDVLRSEGANVAFVRKFYSLLIHSLWYHFVLPSFVYYFNIILITNLDCSSDRFGQRFTFAIFHHLSSIERYRGGKRCNVAESPEETTW